MSHALQLAARGRFTTSPNPMVGCVVVREGKIVGEGWHLRAGEAHAEAIALGQAGDLARSSEVYITLEPCAHYGRTGPCVNLLLEARVGSVIICSEDPNPLVGGSGIEKLQSAGIPVKLGLLEDQARNLNRGFFKRHQNGLPWVTVKMAASLDGRTAMADGQSQWITSPSARLDVQRLRAQSCAIISGIGTQKMDDPSLSLRVDYETLGSDPAVATADLRQPLRVIVDSRCEMASNSTMLSQTGRILVATLEGNIQKERAEKLILAGAEVEFFPQSNGQVDLTQLLYRLAEFGCNNVLVEAGATLAGSFMAQGITDEFIYYMAPKLMGSEARPLFRLPINTMDAHLAMLITDMRRVGDDIRITLCPDPDY
ncbi:MAG: riboflavin biosynthesis protein RibD [Cellvibrionales bacterium TMED49]|nr:MAG: riboflavin biosynthesis protein RibD [Cellvibrionales bacterium TMED49]